MYHGIMSVDPEQLRSAMRHWATGVTIVTAQDGAARHGMTVNSFISVSLEPPLVLVSLERGRLTHSLAAASGYFGVSILPEAFQHVSDLFAGRLGETGDRFDGLTTFQLVSQTPLLAGCLAAFDCRVVSTCEVGSHTLFIAEVLAVATSENGAPLVYYDRHYHGLKD
jgi:flavin reductase (DIM6/NTAB) family NADH-FMN oxidoreductase RutF